MSETDVSVYVGIPRCHRCNATQGLIDGDGPLVCKSCIEMLGGIAGDPHKADHRILEALLERHGDVVSLQRFPRGPRGETEMRWVWTNDWPGAL